MIACESCHRPGPYPVRPCGAMLCRACASICTDEQAYTTDECVETMACEEADDA